MNERKKETNKFKSKQLSCKLITTLETFIQLSKMPSWKLRSWCNKQSDWKTEKTEETYAYSMKASISLISVQARKRWMVRDAGGWLTAQRYPAKQEKSKKFNKKRKKEKIIKNRKVKER